MTVLLTRPRRGADVAADEDVDWASTWRPLICRYRFVDGSNPTRSLRIGRLWVVPVLDEEVRRTNPTGGEEGCWGLTGTPARFGEAGK